MRRLLLPFLVLLAAPAGAQFASDAPPGGVAVEPVITRESEAKGGDAPDLVATWEGDPQWLVGVRFSGPAFDGGAYYGRDWFTGSTVQREDDVPVEIVFDQNLETQARVWRRDQGYQDGGTGVFRGAAYDISDPDNPRRLNVTFVEDARNCAGSDALWAPTGDSVGCREYLYVMASDYDGDGSTYAGEFGFGLDLLYSIAARVADGRTLYQSSPASLTLAFPPLRFLEAEVLGNGLVQLDVFYTPPRDLPAGAQIVFEYTPDGGSPTRLGTTYPAGDGAFEALASVDGLDTGVFHSFQALIEGEDGTVLYESAVARARPLVSFNTSLVGVWNERGSWADVWGYTAADGREYALVALQNFGMSVVDISGDTPTEVAFIPTEFGAADSKDVKVIGDHAYLINEVGPVQIIDLSDPTNAVQVGTFEVQPGVGSGGAHNVSVDDEYLYVTGGRQSGNAGVRIYELSNPASPTLVGEFRPTHFQSPYYHDFYVDGDIGYGPNIYGGGVDILDLSDRSNPTRVSTFGYPGSGAHNVCGTADGNTVYVGDEIGSAGNWTRIFDVSDPLNVEFEGDIIVDAQAVVHNCYVTGDLLHIGHYTEGYRVFDVSDALAPVEVAFYDTFSPPVYGFGGVWSIYPFFESGRIAVSDRNGGLFVVEIDPVVTPTEPPVVPGEMEVTLGPNPASGRLSVRAALAAPGIARLTVLDVRGREVMVPFQGEVRSALSESVDTSRLAPGTYVLRLEAEGETVSRTFTVVR